MYIKVYEIFLFAILLIWAAIVKLFMMDRATTERPKCPPLFGCTAKKKV